MFMWQFLWSKLSSFWINFAHTKKQFESTDKPTSWTTSLIVFICCWRVRVSRVWYVHSRSIVLFLGHLRTTLIRVDSQYDTLNFSNDSEQLIPFFTFDSLMFTSNLCICQKKNEICYTLETVNLCSRHLYQHNYIKKR